MERFMCAEGNCIRLTSGPWFYYDNPEQSDFKITDIARGLSNTCRFGGQLIDFYSVAEHSVRAVLVAYSDYRDENIQRACLLHDASEFTCCDIPRPLKLMLKEYYPIQHRVQAAVMARYGIDYNKDVEAVVKEIDNVLLKNERDFFFKYDDKPWVGQETVRNLDHRHHYYKPKCLEPKDAYDQFISMVESLNIKENT